MSSFTLGLRSTGALLLAAAAAFAADPVPSPSLPTDIPLPATAAQVDAFAWQLFSALNWPAKSGQRGVPDPDLKPGAPGPTVWLSYKNSDEIFLPNGVDPGPWNSARAAILQLHQTSKADPHVLQLSAVGQAVGGPLTDQLGHLVFYEKLADEVGYNYIRADKLYNADVQSKATSVLFPFNALEVKAAWRILPAGAPTGRYYTTVATIAPPGATPHQETVGLVGLHLIVKTPHAPQWIWCTFEQVDNVPPLVDGVPSSFNNPSSTQTPNQETTPGVPTQVVRTLKVFPPELVAANAAWQKAFAGTPFQYYELVGAQYPTEPNTPGVFDGSPSPTVLANTVLETYIQPRSSCIACHSTARALSGVKSDFSFLLLNAQAPAPAAGKP